MGVKASVFDTGHMNRIDTVKDPNQQLHDIARVLWRIGIAGLIVVSLAGVAVGLKVVADDLASTGEAFDGLGVVVGAMMAGVSVVGGGIHLLMIKREALGRRGPVLLSALGPGLYAADQLPGMAVHSPSAMLAIGLALGWLLLCGFLIITGNPRVFSRT